MPHSVSRLGDRRRDQDRVDPQAELLVEVAGAVVPPGEAGLVGMELSGTSRPSRPRAALEALALGRRDVGRADERGRVVDVDVGGADVEVARETSSPPESARIALGRGVEEAQLALVERRVDRAAVGDVGGDDAQRARGGLQPARLVDVGLAVEPGA